MAGTNCEVLPHGSRGALKITRRPDGLEPSAELLRQKGLTVCGVPVWLLWLSWFMSNFPKFHCKIR